MSLQQALKQPNAKEFVQAVIKEIHDQVDSDAGLLAPSQRYSTIEEGEVCGLWPEKKWLSEKVKEGAVVVPKRKLWAETKGKNDLKPTSEEHVYRVGFYTIPYIRVHIWSWHIANARK